jgi:hypothetical protein
MSAWTYDEATREYSSVWDGYHAYVNEGIGGIWQVSVFLGGECVAQEEDFSMSEAMIIAGEIMWEDMKDSEYLHTMAAQT